MCVCYCGKIIMTVKRHSLRKEIAIVLIVKLLAILIIWLVFFSHPYESHLSDKGMIEHFYAGK